MQETLTVQIPQNIRLILNRTPEELGRDLRLYAALTWTSQNQRWIQFPKVCPKSKNFTG